MDRMPSVIDLTSDDEDVEFSDALPEQIPVKAVTPPRKAATPLKASKLEAISFSSYEIKKLSSSRISRIRLPDILQEDQKKRIVNSSQPQIFLGYIKEHEESHAPLTITNSYNEAIEPIPPANFAYTDGYALTGGLAPPSRMLYNQSSIPQGCGCNNDSGICDPKTCACYKLHERLAPNPWRYVTKTNEEQQDYIADSDFGGKFAYKDGRLVPEVVSYHGTPIWECNSSCGCTEDCPNRVVQKGRTIPMDLRRSRNKGWTVHFNNKEGKAKRPIKAGTFVTVYAGELVDWSESEQRNQEYEKTSTTYCLDIDNHHIKKALYVDRYLDMCKAHNRIPESKEEDLLDAASEWAEEGFPENEMTLSIDAGLWGNMSRFFSHSCQPTMAHFPVYTEERDIRRPFMAFFTVVDLQDGDELTFDYGGAQSDGEKVADNDKKMLTEELNSRALGTEITVKSEDKGHNLTSMKCGCGTAKCRGYVFFGK